MFYFGYSAILKLENTLFLEQPVRVFDVFVPLHCSYSGETHQLI